MKKKVFSMLSAAAMLCCCLAAPVSAAEAKDYKMGDVNMDGAVDLTDAMLVLEEYVSTFLIERSDGILTDEQCALAIVGSPAQKKDITEKRAYFLYASNLLLYYSYGLTYPRVKEKPADEWIAWFYENEAGIVNGSVPIS